MAELDFSRRVPAVAQGEQLPTPIARSEKANFAQPGNIQGAVNQYAESINWMSSLGSYVATKASNAFAIKLGGELGKKPQGNLLPSFTDFDKELEASYATQAQSTLGIQAQKLISQANLELAAKPRIDADMISKSNQQVSQGLQKIFSMAPDSVRPNMESHYSGVMIAQNEHLIGRMLGEQKTDRNDNLALANRLAMQNIHAMAMAGDEKGAEAALKSIQQGVASSAARKDIGKDEAQIAVDSARQTLQSGKLSREANKAAAENRLPQFMKDLAENKFNVPDKDHQAVYNNVLQTIGEQERLRNEDQQLSIAKYNVALAQNVNSGLEELNKLKDKVSPVEYENAQLRYYNALKSDQQAKHTDQEITKGWQNPETFSHFTDKEINRNFDSLTDNYVKNNPGVSHDEAQVIVAASAGGKIPIFKDIIQNKLLSRNPANIESASKQMDLLNNLEAATVYQGVSQQAKAIGIQFNSQRGSMPDSDLARKITDNLTNIDSSMQKTLNSQWDLILSRGGAGGLAKSKSLPDFALSQLNLDKNKLGGQYFATIYGNDLYNQLNSNFITARGDYDTAVKMTKDYYNQHYGETSVNGKRQITDSPIEKFLGYKGNEVTPYIQQDLLNALSISFAKAKEAHPTDYWETLPLKNGVAEVVRHVQTKDGMKQYRYPINLLGRAGNEWDVMAVTPYGQRNLFLVAPHVGITSYKPNKEAIDKSFKSRTIRHSYIGRA